ncbi:MAG: type II toxin-antitoxin system HicB family antitoxin [Clostridiales Family XIII bacterium]|jgi:predicted RNase H-like HicB family nuclease|nr:type II toxin-antitoxin system HicB family antitoxin [Clostridiales Family XIII bacterium]
MKAVYPVIITETTDKKIPYLVHVPDFDAQTQGKDLADAIHMAEYLISLVGVTMHDDGKPIPLPSSASDIKPESSPWHYDLGAGDEILSEIITLVPVDFDLYRKRLKSLSVRRNVSLPAWLDAEAERAGFNVSAILHAGSIEREARRGKLIARHCTIDPCDVN